MKRPSVILLVLAAFWAPTTSHGAVFEIRPDTSLIGIVKHRSLTYEDTFAAIAREEGIGFNALLRANPGIDPWLPGEEVDLTLPTALLLPDAPREGIVINLSELRLYYFLDASHVLAYPVGIGVQGYDTPTMVTRITTRIENPTWTPPESILREHAARGRPLPRSVPPGPDNPLGSFAMQLDAPGYFIHGTNRPIGVGQRVSHGCIRLYAEHIATLVKLVPNGTQVRIVRQPHKAGMVGGSMFLESYPDDQVADHLSAHVKAIVHASSDTTTVDWETASRTARSARGLPTRVSF